MSAGRNGGRELGACKATGSGGSNLTAGDGIDITADVISVDLDTDAGLEFDAAKLQVKLDGTTLQRLAAGLSVVGLPLQFEVNGIAVGATVTADNLTDLTDGSDADSLHTHPSLALSGGDGIDITAGVVAVDLDTDSGLEFDTAKLQVKLDGSTLQRLAAGVSVVGVPANFTVNGVAVGNTVTSVNLDTLTNGSDADPLHTHPSLVVTGGDGIDITGGVVSVDLDTDAGLEFDAGKLQVKLDGSTVSRVAAGISVQGLPLNFEVNGVAVGNDVTAANLDTLTDGSNADALHTHAGGGGSFDPSDLNGLPIVLNSDCELEIAPFLLNDGGDVLVNDNGDFLVGGVPYNVKEASLLNIRQVSASETLQLTDRVVLVDATAGDVTVTLPAATLGLQIAVKRISTNTNDVIVTSTDLIDGDADAEIAVPYEAANFISDGTTWWVR